MKENRIVIGIGIDRQNKTIEVFDKYTVEHTEAYLEIAKQLVKLLNPKEINEFKIVMENCKFKNLEEWAKKNQEDIAATIGMTKEELDDKIKFTNPDIEKRFTYHSPKGKEHRFQTLRDNAKSLAYEIIKQCPDSRERSLALTKLEEAIMWANASIAREE